MSMRVVETPAPVRLDAISRAIEELAAGRAVVVVDDENRENEGDLILAAALATPVSVGFMVRYTSGVLCVPMPSADADRLQLPPMTAVNEDPKGTAYTVSVDARDEVSTGISAADRARTIQALARPSTTPAELTRPGHVFPLRAVAGGVLRRPGHTEAAVDLTRLAGLPPVGAIGEVVHDDGSVMRAPALRAFADANGLAMVSIADLIRYRRQHDSPVEQVAVTRLPTAHGVFTAHAYRDPVDGVEHVALSMGDLRPGMGGEGAEPVLVRLHSECLTGEAFGSLRCDCGPQLDAALAAVAAAGRGVVVYLRGHEGRGVGLGHKLRAYALQDNGHDTVDANLRLGLPADARDYATGAQILVDLGVSSIALMTNNPAKRTALEDYGLRVARRVALPVTPHPENIRYLRTKRDRMGHELAGLDLVEPDPIDSDPIGSTRRDPNDEGEDT